MQKVRVYQKLYNTAGVLAGTATLAVAGKASAAFGDGWSFLKQESITPGDSVSVEDTATNIVEKVIDYVIAFGGIVAILFLVWNGIKYITSNGDAKKAESARNGIINAIIGIAIIAAAYTILRFGVGVGNLVQDQTN